MTDYFCSACGAILNSAGTEVSDHMFSVHNVDPHGEPQSGTEDSPYLIPVDSNPTDIPNVDPAP